MIPEIYPRPISGPSVDSFPTAPPGSLEYDMAISARKKARTLYYTDTTSRHVDTPQLFAKKHEIVDSLSASSTPRSLSTARSSLNDRAESFLDYVHSIVWGNSKDNTGVTHEDSSGAPISGTPKLLTPKQHEMALANAEAIIKAIKQMTKDLEEIQEVNKEQYADMVSASVTQSLYAFHELLKKQGALKKDEQLLGTQGINLLHQTTRESHEKRKILHEALEESLSSLGKLNIVDSSAKLLTLASSAFYAMTLLGMVTNPALVAVGMLLNVILLGVTGGTTLAKTKLENESTEQNIDIKRIQHLQENATYQSNDHKQDIKSAGAGITKLAGIEAEELDKSKRMLELLKSMAPGAA